MKKYRQFQSYGKYLIQYAMSITEIFLWSQNVDLFYLSIHIIIDIVLSPSQGLHSASVPGILSLDLCLRDTSRIVTGGNDKNAVVFNKDTEQVMAILKGHTKKVTSVIYHPEEVRSSFLHYSTIHFAFYIEYTCI